MTRPDNFAGFAGRLADAAGEIIRGYFRKPAGLSDKADATPVTKADREAEAAMRALIETEFPDHGILGEEGGTARTQAEYVWVLDPIDGTKAFATGRATFGTLIALLQDGAPILGMIDQPILGERWIGLESGTTTFNGAPAKVRACTALTDAWLYATSPYMFQGDDAVAFERLAGAVKHPLFGADCYAYALLASGFADLVCEADLHPWDFCALVPIIEGAGGVITDWNGNGLTMDSDGRVLAAGDERTHAAALDLLNSK